MIKVVALDFDDTLTQTEEACFIVENQVAVELGHDPMSRQTHQRNWGKPLSLAISERIPGIDVEAFMGRIETVHETFVKEGKIDVITPENLAFLDAIKNNQQKVSILTSRSFTEVRHLLHEDHVLAHKVDKFYHLGNTAFSKPDPRVFTSLLQDFAVLPHEVVYIGDALTDAVAAKSAGLHFIALLESGIRTEDDFAHLPVDFFATTLPEAAEYILKY